MTFIKDLIDIPDRVQKGDFVLKLTEGVTDAAETLRHYVVTPELVKCFDAALTFIRSAVHGRTRDRRTGSGHSEAQRLAGWEKVLARAVSHDQLARHGIGSAGQLRRFHPADASGCSGAAGVYVGGDHQSGQSRTRELRRRVVL